VLGWLDSFWMAEATVALVCCSSSLTLAVLSFSGVGDLLCLDSSSNSPELSLPSFSNSPGIEGFVSLASEVLGLWKCTF